MTKTTKNFINDHGVKLFMAIFCLTLLVPQAGMTALQFSNNATSLVADAGGISDVDTSVTVTTGEGALFPALTSPDYFMATLGDVSGNREIVKVTARSSDTFTIVRAQEGTSARVYAQGSIISNRLTAGGLDTAVMLSPAGHKVLSDYADLAAAVTAIGATETEIWLDANDSSNATVPATLAVRPIIGFVQSGTVTWNGPVVGDPNFQWLSGSGHSGLAFATPEWFGGVNDNGAGDTDNTTSINNMYLSLTSYSGNDSKPVAMFGPGPGYNVSGALSCPSNVENDMRATIFYTGSSNIVVLTIGDGAERNTRVNQRLKVVRDNQSDWSTENNVGIRIYNIQNSEVYIDSAQNYTIGVQFIGKGFGVNHNKFFMGRIINNKFGMDLYAQTAGWANENLIIGGAFAVNSGVNTAIDRAAVRITSDADAFGSAYFLNDANIFLKPSFEMTNTGAGSAIGLLIEYGKANRIISGRNEGNDYFIQVENDSYANRGEVSWGNATINDLSDEQDNFVYASTAFSISPDRGALTFNSGPMHKAACFYNTSENVNVPRVNLVNHSNATVYNNLDLITITTDYLECAAGRGVGIFLKTNAKKRFTVRRDVEENYGGRVSVRAYDSNGNILNSGGGGHPYVVGRPAEPLNFEAIYGNVYTTGSDTNTDVFFSVGSDVDYVCIIVRKGTANLRIRSFSVFSVDGGCPAAWPGYEEFIPGINIASLSPDAGIDTVFSGWGVGRTLRDKSPTSGAKLGWICVRSEDSTANGGEPAAETVWAVVDDQNAADADIIGAELDNGDIHWTTINGGPAANNITVTVGVPGGRSIADGAKILWFDFVELANLQ